MVACGPHSACKGLRVPGSCLAAVSHHLSSCNSSHSSWATPLFTGFCFPPGTQGLSRMERCREGSGGWTGASWYSGVGGWSYSAVVGRGMSGQTHIAAMWGCRCEVKLGVGKKCLCGMYPEGPMACPDADHTMCGLC